MPATRDPLFATLAARGFDLAYRSHAEAIISRDFPRAVEELERVLSDFAIPVTELIAGGGGEAKGTQRLRRALAKAGWKKHRFDVEKRIDGVPSQSRSHEVDHVRSFDDGGRIALEIEWNNKDPFFDRDLEHFQRLHADGAISMGIIVTRGRSLHDGLYDLVRELLKRNDIGTIERLAPSATSRPSGNAMRSGPSSTAKASEMRLPTCSSRTSSVRPRRTGANSRSASDAVSAIPALWF